MIFIGGGVPAQREKVSKLEPYKSCYISYLRQP